MPSLEREIHILFYKGGAGNGDRTRLTSLGSWCPTDRRILHLRDNRYRMNAPLCLRKSLNTVVSLPYCDLTELLTEPSPSMKRLGVPL